VRAGQPAPFKLLIAAGVIDPGCSAFSTGGGGSRYHRSRFRDVVATLFGETFQRLRIRYSVI